MIAGPPAPQSANQERRHHNKIRTRAATLPVSEGGRRWRGPRQCAQSRVWKGLQGMVYAGGRPFTPSLLPGRAPLLIHIRVYVLVLPASPEFPCSEKPPQRRGRVPGVLTGGELGWSTMEFCIVSSHSRTRGAVWGSGQDTGLGSPRQARSSPGLVGVRPQAH